jgi:hypothetical protein
MLNQKKSEVFEWRLLVGRFLEGDWLPFYEHFRRAVIGARNVKNNDRLFRSRYGYPYIDDLVNEILHKKIYEKPCLRKWYDEEYDDLRIRNNITKMITHFVVDLVRERNHLPTEPLENIHDGHVFNAAKSAASQYHGISYSEVFESPEKILESKESILDLNAKKNDFYKRLNKNQRFILENSKVYKSGEERKTGMTYDEIAAALGIATATVQINKLKIDKIIKEVFERK